VPDALLLLHMEVPRINEMYMRWEISGESGGGERAGESGRYRGVRA
jgi:hypothetical protein